jgi:hypothetical protein
MKFGIPYMIYQFLVPPSNTSKDTKIFIATPYVSLSLLSQLNVDADTATGNYQTQHGCHCPHVPLFPHAGAQLQIDDATITYSYKSFIRNAVHGPPLLQYSQQHNHWTPATM